MTFNLADYTTVAERIKLFWEKYPDGAIRTSFLPSESNVFICKAELFRNATDVIPFAIGHAREIVADRGVNRDFPLENCETSAIGVSCKNAGIGTEKNGPSREEMEKVTRVQNRETLSAEGYSPYQIGRMAAAREADNVDAESTCKHGAMLLRKGEKNGREFYGFTCINPDKNEQCPADWWELGPNGNWRRKALKNG